MTASIAVPPLALGLRVRTGWAVAVVAATSPPALVAREQLELLGDGERFVYHKAAELSPDHAAAWLARAEGEARARAAPVLQRLAAAHDVNLCAVVAKAGARLPLAQVVAAHPRIHTAEGALYRDVLADAARAAGLRVAVVPPDTLDTKDARLKDLGKRAGPPWTLDWKLATLGAWTASAASAR